MINLSILYVDDEENNLFLFKANFRNKYNIYLAQSGKEGLDILQNHQNEIIVVISDMRMPKMSGVEFIREAKVVHPSIAYFILTGYDYNEEIDKALKEGVIQKFFTKPFDLAEIESAISEVVKQLR